MVNDKMIFRDNVLPDFNHVITKFEVLYLMKNYNVWHKDCTCDSFDVALKAAKRLEKRCKCFTEIRKIETHVATYKRYKYKYD